MVVARERRGSLVDHVAASRGKAMSELVGNSPPDFKLLLTTGESRNLSEIVREGRPVLITFYSNFGAGCEKAVSEVEANAAFYEGKANLLLVNCDDLDHAYAYTRKMGLTSGCPHGSANVPSEYGLCYYPHRTLIGKDGRILMNVGARGFLGFSWADLDRALNAETMWCIAQCGRPLLSTYAMDAIACKACCKSRGLPLPQREARRSSRGPGAGTVSMPDLRLDAPVTRVSPPHPALGSLPTLQATESTLSQQAANTTDEQQLPRRLPRLAEPRQELLNRTSKGKGLMWRRSV
mmetsp:Transcript_34686/g.62972  ORF Transcript_34686/g.62972 Transcript_34686/m.62972 type:complete len:293 (+) Transcript_34686:111-989(+)